MTNRHTEIETRIRNEFDNIDNLDENDWASIKYDAYIEAYNGVDYSGIFEKFGIDEQTEVSSDEFGVDIARNVKEYVENQIGEEKVNEINYELTEDYFSKYESEIRSGIERWLIENEE